MRQSSPAASTFRSIAPTWQWAVIFNMPPSTLRVRKRADAHVEALNHALSNIPPERVRIHLCWGNYEGPHHCDVPLADIVDIAFAVRANGISFEAANPRHGHE